MFTEEFDVANYADDCTAYENKFTINEVITSLERDSICLPEWYRSNYLKPNLDKHHLLLNEVGENWVLKIASDTIKNKREEKVLGFTFDNKLTFESHVTKLCNTASQKLHALARISNLMSMEKRKIIMNAFITSQFGYCPLIWMCHSRKLNTRINKIHERALRIVFQDKTTSFNELLIKAGSVKIHHKNIQVLATEIYKVYHNISPLIMSEVFPDRTTEYNLRGNPNLSTRNLHSVHYGTDSLSHLGPKIWNLVPNNIKDSETLNIFKSKIKMWVPEKCPCRLCKTYIPGLLVLLKTLSNFYKMAALFSTIMVHFILGHHTIVGGETYHFFQFLSHFSFWAPDFKWRDLCFYSCLPVAGGGRGRNVQQNVLQEDSKEIIQITDTEAF